MVHVQQLPDGKHIVDTGLPQKFIKSIWLDMHSRHHTMTMEVMKTPDSQRTGLRMMRYHISLILDKDKRDEIKEKIANLKKERLNDTMSLQEKTDILEDIYIEAMEDMTDYLDMAFGVSHRIAIGID